jgi:hypothetical protein
VNIYNIYEPCINGGTKKRGHVTDSFGRVYKPYDYSRARRTPLMNHLNKLLRSGVGGPDECIDGISAGLYLNDPEVQQALHVQAGASVNGQWSICSNIDYSSTIASLMPLYPCVPYIGDENWTGSLGYNIKSDWHAWFVQNPPGFGNQVAGYAIEYDANGFTFITVKGSGHMVS